MQRIEKTVFISYRRSSAPWALAVYKELQHSGYDVFFDYTGIPSGDFDSSSRFVLAARADLSSRELYRQLPSRLTVSSVERIASTVNLALPGIRYQAIGIPGVLSGQPDSAYFEFIQTDHLWRELATSHGIAIHVAGDFPGLVLEVWAIRRSLGVESIVTE